jgi:hypothetical protein
MNTEPTDAEINSAIAIFCGYTEVGPYLLDRKQWSWKDSNGIKVEIPSYTTSFDALREAMGKMTEDKQKDLRNKLVEIYEENRCLLTARSAIEWLLFHCPARTLAEAVYQVVKGEK